MRLHLFSPRMAVMAVAATSMLAGASAGRAAGAEHPRGAGPVLQQSGDEVPPGTFEDVVFDRGATSSTRDGAVVRGTTNGYALRASEGQTMTVSASALEDNAVLTIFAPSGYRLSEGTDWWQGILPESGEYTVWVSSSRGNATYTVSFEITGPRAQPTPTNPPPSSSAEPQRIRFDPGTNSTSIIGYSAETPARYVFRATSNQRLVLTLLDDVTTPLPEAVYTLTYEDGTVLASNALDGTFSLPATGDYEVTVYGVESADFGFDIAIY